MHAYEYKVIPAPSRGEKAKGLKTPAARFANALENLMNEMGASGWEYVRAELLPNEERSGLTGTTTNWRNVLVFRRPFVEETEDFNPQILDTAGPHDTEDLPKLGIGVTHAETVQDPPLTATPAETNETPEDETIVAYPGAETSDK